MNTKTVKSAKPAKTTSKTANPKTNVRNVTAQVTKLFKGIDNDTAAVVKMQDQLNKRIGNIVQSNNRAKDLVNNISNVALAAATPPAKPAKPATPPAKPAKPAKAPPTPPKPPSKKTPVKPVAAAKVAKPAKVAVTKPAKAAAAKAAKPETVKSATPKIEDNRPALRQLILDTIGKKQPITAANIYHAAEEIANASSFKVWTRQSMYSLLEKLVAQKEIHKVGEGPTATYEAPKVVVSSSVEEDEADRLVARVETTTAVSDVQ